MRADIIEYTVKQVKTLAWAKKNKEYFERLLTTAGDEVGLHKLETWEEMKERVMNDKKLPISVKGFKNFENRLFSVVDRDGRLGHNILMQVMIKLTLDDRRKILKNVHKAFKFSDNIEFE